MEGYAQESQTERSPKEAFVAACAERLDQLVAACIYSREFADKRLELARGVDVSDVSPEFSGKRFAENGYYTEPSQETRDEA